MHFLPHTKVLPTETQMKNKTQQRPAEISEWRSLGGEARNPGKEIQRRFQSTDNWFKSTRRKLRGNTISGKRQSASDVGLEGSR